MSNIAFFDTMLENLEFRQRAIDALNSEQVTLNAARKILNARLKSGEITKPQYDEISDNLGHQLASYIARLCELVD